MKTFDHGASEDVLLWCNKVQETIKQKSYDDPQTKFKSPKNQKSYKSSRYRDSKKMNLLLHEQVTKALSTSKKSPRESKKNPDDQSENPFNLEGCTTQPQWKR